MRVCVCVFVFVCVRKKLLINSNVIQKPFLFMHHCMNKANGGNKKNIICQLTFGSISIPEKNYIERGKIEFMFLGPLITIIAWNICRFLLTLSLTPLVLLNDFLWAAVCTTPGNVPWRTQSRTDGHFLLSPSLNNPSYC